MNFSLPRLFPWIVIGGAALYLVMMMLPPRTSGQMNLDEAAELPIVEGGRVKPLDSFARNTMMIISNRSTYRDEQDKEQPAIKWLFEVMVSKASKDRTALKLKVFRIENDQLLNMLGLQRRSGLRYSIEEMLPKFNELEDQAEQAMAREAKQRDLFDQKVLDLRHHLELYMELASWKSPLAIPPEDGGENWKNIEEAVQEARLNGKPNPNLLHVSKILAAYSQGDANEFNLQLKNYQDQLAKQWPRDVNLAHFESSFNRFEPFYHCTILYVLVGVLIFVSWIQWAEPLSRAAFLLAILTLLVHTWGLVARMYIGGRPPVTNLYSSAIFIGWGCVGLALILEAIYRNGIGILVAAVLGGTTLRFADYLSSSGDTIEMMQAVLDTNFWLATHVTCVTLGYTATLVAGLLGIIYVVRGVFTPSLNREMMRSLGQMIYGIVCFATLLSFTGTVLGGLWADYSWGRFWGWDPKENGAVLIVIWNALLLHARWAGMVKQRGMAVLAIAGNMITGWSWVGTNQLGVGLHAYGFNNTLAVMLVIAWFVHLGVIGVGLLPLKHWRSFAGTKPTPPAPKVQARGPREVSIMAAKS
jgi:ABC-type transport system involved in cytochrome c biogenesis permease subunit